MHVSSFNLHLVPLLPWWLITVLAVALLGVLAHSCLVLGSKQIPSRWIASLAAIRVVIIGLFTLLLLQPVASFSRTATQLPELMVLLDSSQSMAHPGENPDTSRLEEVKQTLSQFGLTAELERRFRVNWFAFARNAIPLEKNAWQSVQPTGDATHFAEALSTAWNYPRQVGQVDVTDSSIPERVLLISDGLDRGTPDLVEPARRLGVPIDVLAPGSPVAEQNAPTISIEEVQASPRVLLGSETHFLVRLRCNRAVADRLVKIVLSDGEKDIDSLEAVIPAGRLEEVARMAYRPTEAGAKRLKFRLAGSAQTKAKSYHLSVQVVDSKHEVLVLQDTWRWEFKFLRRVLEADPSFRFTALLARDNGAFFQFAAPDRRSQLVGFPQSRAQLVGFDTIVLGDVNPRRWPRDLAATIRHVVAEDGKSLIVLAGPNLLNWMETVDLLALLPVEITRESATPVNGPIELRISDEGVRSPFFFRPGAKSGMEKLPALDQVYAPLRKKPQATVLLEAAGVGNSYGPIIVMAEHTVGRGRVLFVGADTIWKWQTLTSASDARSTPYHQFWQQTFRALAPTRTGGQGVNLWLHPRRSRYQAGQRAVLRAEIDAPKPVSNARVQALVSLPDGRSVPIGFSLEPTAANSFQAEIHAEQPGPYRVAATLVADGKTVAEGTTVFEVDEAPPEVDGATVDLRNLARIAAATGGQVVDAGNPHTWPVSSGQRAEITETKTVDLWNDGFLIVLLALIAGLDWFLRLWRGYV